MIISRLHNSISVQQIQKLWQHLNPRRRVQCAFLLALMLISALTEVISIGALLPFLSTLAAPEKVFSYPLVHALAGNFGIKQADEILLPLTVIFILAAIISGSVRLLLLWATTKFTFTVGADLSSEIYRRTLYQPYNVHIARNSSEIISGITNKTHDLIFHVILPSLTIINSLVLLVFLCSALLYVSPLVTLGAAGSFGLCYIILAKLMHKRLVKNGHIVAKEQTNNIRILQEGLGGIRDVLLDNTQSLYCDIYRNSDMAMRRAQGINLFINTCPRYAMESIGIVTVAIISFILSYNGGIAAALPTLGALALGVQRLLPALQQSYNSWSLIMGSQATLRDTLLLLEQKLPEYVDVKTLPLIEFNEQIKLENVTFRYAANQPDILNINKLVIPKGARVGIVGSTGSGKSTLLDVIMGLLLPSSGLFSVDGKKIDSINAISWQRNIAHVPQNIYLNDGSFAENIALGIPVQEIDMERVKKAARLARIADFIESGKDGYQAMVGERGIKLSGGQRQRVGIARALYKNAKILVLDEATSALDNDTEAAVMESIENLHENLTILIVAHRLSTLKKCNFIVKLENGEICQS